MFSALEDYFSKKPDARGSKRVEKTFPVLYSADKGTTWMGAVGLNIGLGGLKVFSQTPIVEGEIPMRLQLDSHVLDIRVRQAWHTTGRYKGGLAHEYGMQFAAANAEDRERVERWLAGGPLAEINKAQSELKEIHLKPDDVNRLIPLALQKRIFSELVGRGRLVPPDEKHPPLVAYDYGGIFRYRGVPMHRLTVHSKVMRDDGEDRYSTRILFDEHASNLVILDGMSRAKGRDAS